MVEFQPGRVLGLHRSGCGLGCMVRIFMDFRIAPGVLVVFPVRRVVCSSQVAAAPPSTDGQAQ